MVRAVYAVEILADIEYTETSVVLVVYESKLRNVLLFRDNQVDLLVVVDKVATQEIG